MASQAHCIYAGSISAVCQQAGVLRQQSQRCTASALAPAGQLVAAWCTCGRPEAVSEPCSLTFHAFDIDHCSTNCQPMLLSAALHAGIACSCLRSSVEAAAAHSEAAEEVLTHHQKLASVMVFQVGDTAKAQKDTGIRCLLSQLSHSSTAWQRGRAAQACT